MHTRGLGIFRGAHYKGKQHLLKLATWFNISTKEQVPIMETLIEEVKMKVQEQLSPKL